jgi:phage shock protein B
MDDFIPIIAIVILFLGLPWLIFHYITKWKTAATLTGDDEKLLDELHDMARRLDDRMATIERIMNAENPNWQQAVLPDASTPLPDEILTTARTRRGEKA